MMSTPLDPCSRLTLAVFRAQLALSAEGDRLAAPDDLTSAQWKVLGAIALAEEAPSAAAIGRAMGLSRQAALKQVQLLLEREMIVGQPNPLDARAPVFSATPRGQVAYASVMGRWQARSAVLFADLSPSALETACQVLETVLGQLQSPAEAA